MSSAIYGKMSKYRFCVVTERYVKASVCLACIRRFEGTRALPLVFSECELLKKVRGGE